jgi:hypothetical protein
VWAADLCDAHPGTAVGEAYPWLADYLDRAVDGAEERTCGSRDCALHERALRFYVVSDDAPLLASRREDAGISILLTTKVIDAIESAVAAASIGQLAPWLSNVDHETAGSCRGHTLPTGRSGREAALPFYELLVADEIAHLRLGSGCGEGEREDDYAREAACMRAARGFVRSRPHFAAVAGSLALAHLESLDRYAQATSPTAALLPPAPLLPGPAEWSQRAADEVNLWDETSTRATEPVPADVRAALALPRPRACGAPRPATTSAARASAADGDASARACFERVPASEGSTLRWDSEGDPILARIELTYRNTCTRTIRCRLITVVDSSVGQTQSEDWLTLRPRMAGTVTRVLSAPLVGGVPRLLLPDGAGDSHRVSCEWL